MMIDVLCCTNAISETNVFWLRSQNYLPVYMETSISIHSYRHLLLQTDMISQTAVRYLREIQNVNFSGSHIVFQSRIEPLL